MYASPSHKNIQYKDYCLFVSRELAPREKKRKEEKKQTNRILSSPNPNSDDLMANENQIESHHRKHHRSSSSSSDEADKSSKRHKHRHHKHHHKRHHRHRRDKKREDEIPSGEDEAELMDVTPIGVSNGGGDDVEEGEILDEEGLANAKTVDSDGESGEIKSDRIQDNDLVCSNRPFLSYFCL